jgi:hypothetical protein
MPEGKGFLQERGREKHSSGKGSSCIIIVRRPGTERGAFLRLRALEDTYGKRKAL